MDSETLEILKAIEGKCPTRESTNGGREGQLFPVSLSREEIINLRYAIVKGEIERREAAAFGEDEPEEENV